MFQEVLSHVPNFKKKKQHSETSELSLIKISHMKITKSPLPTHFESQGGKIPH